ncbi:MAG: hypothetical protein KDD56_02935, partial [Bdellovibrionales bacterium]|nr:hypothetical protein [Bdellovibrionales bacterium]
MRPANSNPDFQKHSPSIFLKNLKFPKFNRKIAILLLSFSFLPNLVEKNTALAKEEPEANNPGKVLNNPNAKLELPSSRQMAIEERLQASPVYRKFGFDLLVQATKFGERYDFSDEAMRKLGEFTLKTHLNVTGVYDILNSKFDAYQKANETVKNYVSHSYLPIFLKGVVDFASLKTGTKSVGLANVAKDVIDRRFAGSTTKEIAEANESLYVAMPVSEQARLLMQEYEKGGWAKKFLDDNDFFGGLGIRYESSPEEFVANHPSIAARVETRTFIIERREEINKLNSKLEDLKKNYHKGNSELKSEIDETTKALNEKIGEVSDYVQNSLTSAIANLQDGVDELIGLNQEQIEELNKVNRQAKAKENIDKFYAVTGALTDVLQLIDPQAANLVNGVCNLAGSIMAASASEYAFSSIAGIASSLVGFLGSLFSTPDSSMQKFIQDNFEELEKSAQRRYLDLVERIGILDKKLDYLIKLAEETREFQFDARTKLQEIALGVVKNSALLKQILKVLNYQDREEFIHNCSHLLSDYYFYVKLGKTVSPDRANIRDDLKKYRENYFRYAEHESTDSLILGAYVDDIGFLDTKIKMRGLAFSEGLISQMLRAKFGFDIDSTIRNGLLLADATTSLIQIPKQWGDETLELSPDEASQLALAFEGQLKFYQALTDADLIDKLTKGNEYTIGRSYQEMVSAVIEAFKKVLDEPEFRSLSDIPNGIDLSRGLEQFLSPVFKLNEPVNLEEISSGIQFDFLAIQSHLTQVVREQSGKQWFQFPPMPNDFGLKIDLYRDMFNFNSDHILRTALSRPILEPNGKVKGTLPGFNLKNSGRLKVNDSEDRNGPKISISDFIIEKLNNDPINATYRDTLYRESSLDINLTFEFDLDEVIGSKPKEFSKVTFKPEIPYKIAVWYDLVRGNPYPNPPENFLDRDFYTHLSANWEQMSYCKVIKDATEFTLRILQHLATRDGSITLRRNNLDSPGTLEIKKGVIKKNDIQDVTLEVNAEGFSGIYISIDDKGAYRLTREQAEFLLREMHENNVINKDYLNFRTFLPHALKRELHSFSLELQVFGIDRTKEVTPSENRYKLMQENAANQLLVTNEAFTDLYNTLLKLDDISTTIRTMLGLSVPDEIAGSLELMNSIREDT